MNPSRGALFDVARGFPPLLLMDDAVHHATEGHACPVPPWSAANDSHI